MASGAYRNLKDGRITLIDGAGTTLTLVGEDDSGFGWEEADTVEAIHDRTTLSQWRPGMDEPVTLSATIHFKYLLADSGELLSPYEVFRFIGGAAAYVSTNLTCTDVKTLTVRFQVANPCPTALAEGETIQFTQVPKPAFSFQEGAPVSTLSMEGKALMSLLPTPTRSVLTTTTTTTTTT